MIFRKRKQKKSYSNIQAAHPEPVFDNYLLQYNRPGQSGECELVIGLDFGTSSSKVVIQAPDLPGRLSYAVDFGHLSKKSIPYLLPTKLWITPDGICTLGPRDGARMISDIKLELFSTNEQLTRVNSPTRNKLSPEEMAAIYLALVLRFCRKWFLETKQNEFRHFGSFRWNFNLGVPSPCIENNEKNITFRRVGKAAWKLSTLSEELINPQRARTELVNVDVPEYWDTDEDFSCDFDIIPEIAAGAVGYALSEHRREGLHVMVDIGASTVDVCSFKLYSQEGSDHYSLLLADVQQLGTMRLFNHRLTSLISLYERQLRGIRDAYDPMDPIDDDIESLLLSHKQLNATIEEGKAQFKQHFLKMLKTVIWQTKLRKDPKSLVWSKGQLPILFTGGGSKMLFFRSAVDELDAWLKHYTKNNGINLLPIPVPASLTDSVKNTDEHQFFAVTWGLSHRAIDVGEVIPADCNPDIKLPPPLDWRKRYVDKDQV